MPNLPDLDTPKTGRTNADYLLERCELAERLNGKLMALNADLLAACEQAEFWLAAELVHPGECKPDMILTVLRAAIAKATSPR